MVAPSINLNLTISEIYNCLCDCGKEKMQQLVKEKMAEEIDKVQKLDKEKMAGELMKKALEGEPKEKEGGKS